MDVLGKVVLITGASAGIGLCTARRFGESSAIRLLKPPSVMIRALNL